MAEVGTWTTGGQYLSRDVLISLLGLSSEIRGETEKRQFPRKWRQGDRYKKYLWIRIIHGGLICIVKGVEGMDIILDDSQVWAWVQNSDI